MKYTTRGLRNRRGTNKWDVTLSHKDPFTGDTIPSYHTVEATTRKKAEKARDELIRSLEQRGCAKGAKTTVGELLDDFVSQKEEGELVEPSTVHDYKKQARLIKRYLDDVRLSNATIPALNAWIAKMVEDGYAPRTISKALTVLRMAMKYAVACDLIDKNPAAFCKPPKQRPREMKVLDREGRTRMMHLARSAEATPLGLAIEIALSTGMRRGEICALRWSDLGDHEITVSHAISLVGGTIVEKDPKTPGSKRTIPLTRRLNAVLHAIEKDAKYVAAELGTPFGDPYILGTPDPNSRPYHPSQLTKEFTSFCKVNGFDCTFHDLRHTFATMMISGGTDVRTVASYLGHSNVAMTLNTYAEVDPDAKRAAVSKVSEAFDIDDSFFDERDPLGDPVDRDTLTITLTMEQFEGIMARAKRDVPDADGPGQK